MVSYVFHLFFICFTHSFVSIFPLFPHEGVPTWTIPFMSRHDMRTNAGNGSCHNSCMSTGFRIYIPPKIEHSNWLLDLAYFGCTIFELGC